MKRLGIVALCLLLVIVTGTLLYFRGREYKIVITQEQINTALQEKFPLTRSFLILRLTYANPRVTLLPHADRIQVGLDAELNIQILAEPKNLSGSALVNCGLIYRAEKQQFFLSDPVIEKLAFEGIPAQHLTKVNTIATKLARDYLQQSPVYTLKANNAKTAAAKLLLKEVKVKDGEIHLTLGL